jgi:hypothetical protein
MRETAIARKAGMTDFAIRLIFLSFLLLFVVTDQLMRAQELMDLSIFG